MFPFFQRIGVAYVTINKRQKKTRKAGGCMRRKDPEGETRGKQKFQIFLAKLNL